MRRVLLAGGALALGLGVHPAAASCAAPVGRPDLREHDSVFTGTVTGLRLGGTTAEVAVRDVWHGPDLPPEVVVVGGQLRRGVAASTDRSYTRGRSYVFFVQRDEDGVLRDGLCTPTARIGSYEELDPVGVRAPDPDAVTPTDPRGSPWAAWAAGAAVLVGAGVLVRRRRA